MLAIHPQYTLNQPALQGERERERDRDRDRKKKRERGREKEDREERGDRQVKVRMWIQWSSTELTCSTPSLSSSLGRCSEKSLFLLFSCWLLLASIIDSVNSRRLVWLANLASRYSDMERI